jgi:hypothetical protein
MNTITLAAWTAGTIAQRHHWLENGVSLDPRSHELLRLINALKDAGAWIPDAAILAVASRP